MDLSGPDFSGKDLSNSNFEKSLNFGSNFRLVDFKNTKLANSTINDVIYENIEFLIFEHSYQNSIEPISQSLGYIQRATIKIIDKYFLNSI